MARCKSVDVLQQIILDSDVEEMEISDSDLEDNGPLIVDLDADEEKEEIVTVLEADEKKNDSKLGSDEITSDREPVVANGPVLSLVCLHDESSNEDNRHSEIKSQFIDPDDVQDLAVNIGGEKELPRVEVLQEKNPSTLGCNSFSKSHSAVPARSDWGGAHNFKINISSGDLLKRSECSIFSEQHKKLYVSKDYPFKVLVSAENVPAGSVIKASAIFALAEHAYESVQRCPTHAQQDFLKGLAIFEHFVQCFSDMAVYEKDYSTGKLSVSVPFEKPKEGETCSAYLFKLTCFNSCLGGINRRPFKLVFALENNGVLLGRQSVEAKVCACPLRDYKLDTERAEKVKGSPKKSRTNSADSQNLEKTKYSIVVKDPELYLFLKQMKALYETSAYASKLNSDT